MNFKLAATLAAAGALMVAAPAGAGASASAWHVVSFDHRITATDRAAIDRAGAREVQPWARRAYKVLLDSRGADQLRAVARVRRLSASELPKPSWPRGLFPEDEGTVQMLAGNVTGVDIPKPGYREWLKGVGIDGTGAQVSIVDTGVDEQHPDLVGRVAGKVNYVTPADPQFDDLGHGSHVAGIVAGIGGAIGSVGLDSDGLYYGLGMAPGAMLIDQNAVAGSYAVSEALGEPEFKGLIPKLAADAVRAGSTAWNASWHTGEGAGAGYTESSRQADAAVRDADPEKPGEQPLTMVFSAGNAGGGEYKLTTPHEAKNIISVASSVSHRGGDTQTISDFSSRGPARDGRIAPTLTAPGGRVMSTKAIAGPICAGPSPDPAAPSPLHTPCSGTSMAAPHVAGAVALITQWWRLFNGGANPSPAMSKALLVNTTVDLGEADVPNKDEGWGRIHTGALLASGTKRIYSDQKAILTNPGQSERYTVQPVDPAKPMRVTVAWTDPAGAAQKAHNDSPPPALVNDLDLRVNNGGTTFVGNAFGNGASTTGGEPDKLNNLENVWLPKPAAGLTEITVTASNLPGDGVPGQGDKTDQDFALVVSNAELVTVPAPAGAARVVLKAAVKVKRGKVTKLLLRDVPAGATVNVTCKGSCPRKGVTRRFASATKRASLVKLVRRWKRVRRLTVTLQTATGKAAKTFSAR